MTTQPLTLQRYRQHQAAFTQAPGKTTLRLTFRRALTTGGLLPVLRAVFDELTTEYVLPDEEVAAGSAHYWLTPAGYGLRLAREQTGAVRGDAYTDYLDLLLPGGVLLSTEITEDSYQPTLVLTLTTPNAGVLDRLADILVRLLRQAGCEPLPG